MKAALLICLLVFSQLAAEADWTVAATEQLAGPAGVEFSHRTVSQAGQDVQIHVVSFNPKSHSFAVMDNPEGALTLATAAQKRGALAAVNGGYFHSDRTPLGLVIWQGKTLHPLERARLLSGMVVSSKSRISLQRVSEFKDSPAISDALQAGPFLIDGGKPVVGLNAERTAARTVVFIDDTGRCGLFVCQYATLAEAAEILATRGLVGPGKITRALNLDGGSSTGLWVRGEPPFYLREGKDVRNYLGIIKR